MIMILLQAFSLIIQACICFCFSLTLDSTTDSLFISSENECMAQESTGPLEYICQGLASPASLTLVPVDTVHLTLRGSNLMDLHSTHIQHLTSLTKLTIITSRVVLLQEQWSSSLPLQQLTLHQCWSQLPHHSEQEVLGSSKIKPHLLISPQIWTGMVSLTNLTVVDCNIMVDESQSGTALGFELLPPSCFLTILDGEYECKGEEVYLLQMVADGRAAVHNTTCFILDDISKFTSFYTFIGKPLMSVLTHRKSLELCPEACKCDLRGFRSIDRPIMSVNCTDASLSALPKAIPPLSSTLIMSHNKLENLDALFSNPFYSRLANCDFSDNAINSINGSALVHYISSRSHDIKFDLRQNNLTMFPVWKLSSFYNKALRSGKKHLPVFDLSGNPWNCHNCSFSPYFKSFVYDNMFHVRDHVDVRCERTGPLLLHMDFNSMCHPPSSPILPIDILNIFMALMLTIILVDFVYNYYQYRRHGKLPWIVRTCKIC